MKKNLMFVSAAVMGLVSLAGCSGGGSETVTLTVWGGENETGQQYMTQMASSFETYWAETYPDRPAVTVKVGAVSEANATDEIERDPQAAADFALVPDDGITRLVSGGYITSLEEMTDVIDVDAVKSRNSATSVEVATRDNKLYAFPVSASNGYFLYYDASKIAASETTTFDKLLAAIDAVSTKDGVNYRFGYPTGSGWYIDGWWRGAGYDTARDSSDSSGTASTCEWDSTSKTPTGVKVASAMLKLTQGQYYDHWVGAGDTELLALTAKGAGQVIAWVSGTWNASAMQANYGTAAATTLPSYNIDGTDYRVKSVAGCKVGVVNATTGHAAYAAAFGEYITRAENQKIRYEICAEAPTNSQATSEIDFSSNYAVEAIAKQINEASFVQALGNGYWTPAGTLATILYNGTDADIGSMVSSGAHTANVVVNETNLQALLTRTATAIRAKG